MNKWIRRLILLLAYLFLYAPIIVLVVFSFNEGKTRGLWTGFSLQWYESLFQNREIMQALRNTLSIAALTTVISTIIGTAGAIGIDQFQHLRRRLTLGINQIPVTNPDIVMAVGLMVLYRLMQLEPGYLTLLLSHIAFTIPYVVLSVLPKLREMPDSIVEAALDLGASPLQAVRLVILPYCKTAIISGAIMAFTLSIDDFVISFFTTGNGVENISTMVYAMARRGINPEINALSTLLFASMLILLVAMNVYTARSQSDQEYRP